MKIDPSIHKAKSNAQEALLKRKGVTGVGIGHKIVKGKKTSELAIRVYVEKKLPKGQLGAKELIPDEIEGVKTDVIERKFVLHPTKVALQDLELKVDTGRYAPLTGGISIGPCRVIDGFVFVGTLGCMVEDNRTGERMMLSNFHVMCVDNGWTAGDTIAQPGRPDGGRCPADVVGTLERSSLGGEVDCAVARINGRTSDCAITGIGRIKGTANAVIDQPVRKRGRTTELTHGFVDDVDLTVTVDYEDGIGNVTLNHQIGIEVDTSQSTQIGDSGDSGSVVVNARDEVIGLYFAGNETGTHGVANPIRSVLAALDVRMCRPFTAPKPPWLDTSPWADLGVKFPWFDPRETNPWLDRWHGGTPIKFFDDVKSPAYDTQWEHQIPGHVDPGPDWRGGGPAGPGLSPFGLATKHHAPQSQRLEAQAGNPSCGEDPLAALEEEINRGEAYVEQLRQHYQMAAGRPACGEGNR